MGILDIIFPWYCVGCGIYTRRPPICDNCFANIPLRDTLSCARCFARIPDASKICHPDEPVILGGAAPYSDPASGGLVRALKFDFIECAAEPLGDILARYILALMAHGLPRKASLIPVPLGSGRLRERGFNQAELIARHVSKLLELPCATDILMRVRDTGPQSMLSRADRTANVADCFAAHSDPGEIPPAVFLIDDVITTGDTLRSAALALRAAGFRRIYGLAPTISA